MRCSRCQTDNREGRRFCSKCGTALAPACASCGFSNEAGDEFCGGCGERLGSPQPIVARFASPESYTPRHLAERILTSKGALEGERKQVTVLFADLKGSMELLADRDPEEARKVLDPVLKSMMEAVHRYEGTVNQVMGDGIMALFGAPLALEDHAVRACYAALRMHDSVGRYALELRRSQGVDVQIRVGINSGEVVVRSIGSDLRMDYSAVGQTTHLAARMEQLARPGLTLITAETLGLAEGYVAVKPLGLVPVKGLPGPVETYELIGAGPARSRLQAAAARGLSRFVGRAAEMDQLHQALEAAGAGRGQVVAAVGEAGVGKSRLVHELTQSHRTRGWLMLGAGSVSYGKATSYLPVIDLLKSYFKIQDHDEQREILEKVAGKLLILDRALEPTLPALLALLDVPINDTPWQSLDPFQRRHRTLEALKRFLLRESQVQPLLLIFEDLHWIDSETQALLDSVVESVPTARILVLVNYRPEYSHAWGGKTYYTQLRLDALPPATAAEFLHALLGGDAGLEPLKALLIARTAGNPFFLEESVRTLVETKTLAGTRGDYRLARAVEAVSVPVTVQAMLAARIDRLPAEQKRLLQTAAVIGKDVPLGLLLAVAEETEEAVRGALAHLQSAELLYETSLFPDPEYTFKHALTHEVAYANVLQDRRRALHARILQAGEALYADRPGEQAERLAHHAFRGELWGTAVAHLRHAGTKAVARSANREAVAWFEQALAALAHLPESREALELGVDLRFDLRHSLGMIGQSDQIRVYLEDAERLARRLVDPLRLGLVSAYASLYYWYTRDLREALRFGQSAQTIADTAGDVPLQVQTDHNLGLIYYSAGDYHAAQRFFRKAVRSLGGAHRLERMGGSFPSVYTRAWLAASLAELGEFEEGIAEATEGIRIGEAVDHPFSLGIACRCLGSLYTQRGDLGEAIPLLERAVALGLEAPAGGYSGAGSWLGYAYALAGQADKGLALLQETLGAVEAGAAPFYHTLLVRQVGEAYLLARRPREARALAERSLALARQREERGDEPYALRLLGEIAAHHDCLDAGTAEGHYREAMMMAERLGMRPLVAHCYLGLGKLWQRTSRFQDARQHVATATTMYREMDMRFWLEQAETDLRALRGAAKRS